MKHFFQQSSFKSILCFNLLFIITAIFLFTLFLPPFTARAECQPTKGGIILNVPIPGVGTEVLGEGGEGCGKYEIKPGSGTDSPPQLVVYIKGMYKFFVGIAGILAVFMLMFGGVQWLFSGGNASKIASAKETIFGAVIGLVLALGSYTLLVTINPRLVNLTLNLRIVATSQEDVCYDFNGNVKPADELPCGLVCQPKLGKSGETVIGACELCIDEASQKSCGNTKLGEVYTKKDGNCVYANCVGGQACIYTSELNSLANNEVGSSNSYKPHCESELTIQGKVEQIGGYVLDWPVRDGKCSLETGTSQDYVGPAGMGGFLEVLKKDKKCGEIWVKYIDNYTFDCRIGTICDNGGSCVRDISKIYNRPQIFITDTKLNNEHGYKFNGFECKK